MPVEPVDLANASLRKKNVLSGPTILIHMLLSTICLFYISSICYCKIMIEIEAVYKPNKNMHCSSVYFSQNLLSSY